MRLIVFEAEAREAAAFERLEPNAEVELVDEPLKADNVERFAEAEIVSTFIYSRLDRETLKRMDRLKMIATRSTGVDHIDLSLCEERGILVSNVPTYGERTVAEHSFALMLALAHRLPEAMARARAGPFSPRGLEGFDLAGKTLGVMGTGSIGRHVVEIGRSFAMEVLAYDLKPDPELAQRLAFRYVELDELLSSSDIVSLHLPATPETEGILSEAAFEKMRPGALVINTARGSLIDHQALIRALRSGKLAGAGLDVLAEEPLIREEAELVSALFAHGADLRNVVADHLLLRMPNVIVTPHSAFNSREAVARILETTVENIKGFLEGKPVNRVAGPTGD